MNRRRFIRIAGAAAGVPLAIGAARFLAPQPQFHEWQGEALGAQARLALWHPNADFARQTINRMLVEVRRLEGVFSLWDRDSELSRLNRDGALADASADLANLVEETQHIAAVSGGAFDPTVQPLWACCERSFLAGAGEPDRRAIDTALALVDHRAIDVAGDRIAFARPGMAMTLNGIAQGAITDRIADLLRNEGFDHVMVDLGEVRTLGSHPEGRPWRVAIDDPRRPIGAAHDVLIADQSLAVSAGYGTAFDAAGHWHHLFDPATGHSAGRMLDVTVVAPRATTADALSTAIFVAGEARAPALLAAYPGSRAIVTRLDGTLAEIGA